MTTTTNTNLDIKDLAKVGIHLGFNKSRRHPTMAKFIYETKNRLDVFDLDKSAEKLFVALEFLRAEKQKGNGILIVGGKSEAAGIVREICERESLSYVAGRWMGGTLTNFSLIHKRVEEMHRLVLEKDRGEFSKYTKKERLLLDRRVEKLEKMYYGIRNMTAIPKVIFLIDHRYEAIALREAKKLGVATVSLCSSDNSIAEVDYPIPGNDTSVSSIRYILEKVVESYK